VTMIGVPLLLLGRRAPSDGDPRFLLLLGAFLFMLAMAYGEITRDLPLFMVLGVAISTLTEKYPFLAVRRELWLSALRQIRFVF
jgi:hypothetical protein